MSITIGVPAANSGDPGFAVQRMPMALCISAGITGEDTTLFGVTNDEGGLSLSAYPAHFPSVTMPTGDFRSCAMSDAGDVLIIPDYVGYVNLSIDYGVTWTKNYNGRFYSCAVDSDGSVLLGSTYAPTDTYLYLSVNGGQTWVQQPAQGRDCAMDSDGSVLLGGGIANRPFLSTDGGSNWAAVMALSTGSWFPCAVDSDGSVLMVGQYPGKVYLSTDGGSTWPETAPGGTASRYWRCIDMDSDGSTLLAGTWIISGSSGRLYLSGNGGSSWSEATPAGSLDLPWTCCAVNADGTVLVAGYSGYLNDPDGGGRLYLSENSGSSWAEVRPAGDADMFWSCCAINAAGTQLLAGCARHGASGEYTGTSYLMGI